MKLSNGILRPGTVIEVLEDGCIKAIVPGLFSSNDSPDLLPPIYPFLIGPSNTFSSIKEDDNIWVLNFSDNPMQLYWFRRDDFPTNNAELMDEENVEIICNRETPLGWATIYFSNGSGWIIRNDESVIQIDSDGNILLSKSEPHRTIHINDNGISLGSKGESAHPAAYGDEITEALQNIQISLELIQKVSLNNPFTAGIATALGTKPLELKTIIPKITSPHVTLD
jgi:hypothetical protein